MRINRKKNLCWKWYKTPIFIMHLFAYILFVYHKILNLEFLINRNNLFLWKNVFMSDFTLQCTVCSVVSSP